jgi:hypothetical protein
MEQLKKYIDRICGQLNLLEHKDEEDYEQKLVKIYVKIMSIKDDIRTLNNNIQN